MENNVFNEWKYESLGNYIKVRGGKAFKSKDFKEQGVPILRISNIKNNGIDLKNCVYADPAKLQKYSNFLLENGNIVIAMSGATTGKTGTIQEKNLPLLLNQRVGVFEIQDNTIINQRFLKYVIASTYFQKILEIDAIGGAQPNISPSQIESIHIYIPPINEQQKIASILSSIDEAISKTELIIDKTEIVKKGLVQTLFFKGVKNTKFKATLFGEIPQSWEVIQLGEIFENRSEKKQGHLQVLTVTQTAGVIPRDEFSMNIKYDKDSLSNYKKVDIGNFIISLRSFQGGLEKSNYIGLVSPAYTVLKNQVPINITYFEYLFKSYWFIEQLKSSTIGIRDGKQISYSDFKLIKIPLPSLEEQKEVVDILESVDKKIDFERNRLENLISIKHGLMQQLLTGKVRVPLNENEEVPQ